jgi:hypothetical protein
VLKRNADIEELTMRTEQLDDSSASYRVQTQAIKKKMVWKNRKWAFILACCCVLILVVRAQGFVFKALPPTSSPRSVVSPACVHVCSLASTSLRP